MIVTMTSWAPKRAFSQPTMPPQIPPPITPATIATQQVQDGRQVPGEPDVRGEDRAPDGLALGTDVEQPARKARPTPSPAQISGAACAVVSVIGPQPPIDPAIRAEYALLTLSHEAISASEGRAKK